MTKTNVLAKKIENDREYDNTNIDNHSDRNRVGGQFLVMFQ